MYMYARTLYIVHAGVGACYCLGNKLVHVELGRFVLLSTMWPACVFMTFTRKLLTRKTISLNLMPDLNSAIPVLAFKSTLPN